MWFFNLCILSTLSNSFLCQLILDQAKYINKQYSLSCIDDTHVDTELVDRLQQGDFSSEDFRLKNYAFCMLNKHKMVKFGGALLKNKVVEMLMTDVRGKAEQAIEYCTDRYDYERIDKMWTGIRCFYDRFPNQLQFF